MRIVAGHHRGRRITAPSGNRTRPTSDRVREALFSIIGPVDGMTVLDLFAGSGALGLEALSRGAAHATFIDRDAAAIAAIRRNITILDDPAVARVVRSDWSRALVTERRRGTVYELCLIDPPYSLLPQIRRELPPALAPILGSHAMIVIESSADDDVMDLPGLHVTSRVDREYGGTRVSVIRIDKPE